MFGIAVQRHQQRFIDAVGIQSELFHRFITEIGFGTVVMIGMKSKGDFLFL
ncbi:hypothetical protein D3C78_1780910 [compost metagenome]